MTEPDQIAALRTRLAGRRLDILFVNAGTANTKIAADMLLSKDLKDVKAGTCDLVP